jgi:hypothetical protein
MAGDLNMRSDVGGRASRFDIRQFVADAVVGLALFALAVSFFGSGNSAGAARLEALPAVGISAGQQAAQVTSKPGLVSAGIAVAVDGTRPMALATLRPDDWRIPLAMLGLVFSGLLAMNMALLRHMRRTARAGARKTRVGGRT